MTELIRCLNNFAPYWADALWRATWQGGLMIAAVWVLCSICPQIPPRARCWLWRLAFAKLLLCLLWTSPVKLALLPAAKSPVPAAATVQMQSVQVLASIPAPPMVASVQTAKISNSPATKVSPSMATVILALWASGVAACLLRIARQWWLTKRLIRNSRKAECPRIKADCVLLAERFGVRPLPEVRLSEGLGSPLLAGFQRPAILVPRSFLETKSQSELRMMVAHELAHLKRRDLWWAWLGIAGRVLFFFHPLVWLANKESRLADEMAADELTLAACDLAPVDYARMLVTVAASFFTSRQEQLSVAVVDSKKILKRRLQAMKHISTTSNRRLMAAATIVAILGLGAIVPWQIVAQEPAAGPQMDQKVGLNPAQIASRGANDPDTESPVPNPTDSKHNIFVATVFVDADGRYHEGDREMGLNKLVSNLKKSLEHAPESIVRVEVDEQTPYQSLLALLDRMKDAGIKRVSLRTVSGDTSKPQIFDVAFGVWRPAETKQTGPAAAGRKGDYWNAPGVPWNNDHTESGLKFASGDASPIQVRMVNLGGGWGNDGTLGIKSPMMDSYDYPVNNQGGDAQVILSNVPPGKYDVYIYGHEREPWAYGDYTLSVGDHNDGRKTTSNKSDAIENTKWVEGSQYVKFAGVEVGAGNDIKVLIKPGGEVTDHWGRTFSDATICGLQLIPVK